MEIHRHITIGIILCLKKNSTMEWYYIDARIVGCRSVSANALNISTPLVIGGSSPTTGPRVDFDLLKIFNYTGTSIRCEMYL